MSQERENYIRALEERLHWILHSGPLNLSEDRLRWLHEPFGDDLSRLPASEYSKLETRIKDLERQISRRCAECSGDGAVRRSFGYVPCPACGGKGH